MLSGVEWLVSILNLYSENMWWGHLLIVSLNRYLFYCIGLAFSKSKFCLEVSAFIYALRIYYFEKRIAPFPFPRLICSNFISVKCCLTVSNNEYIV
jgi:hypothetical protein